MLCLKAVTKPGDTVAVESPTYFGIFNMIQSLGLNVVEIPTSTTDGVNLHYLERTIEQLKANQQQMASDNSKAIGELKASQEEMKRAVAKVSEQTPPKASPPPAQPAPALRRPERTYQPPQARARPRYYPREWIYDDYDW